MATVTARSVSCSTCGHDFDDYDAANAVTDAGDRILACPQCGEFGRTFAVNLAEQVTAADSLTVALRPGDQGRGWSRRWAEAQRELVVLQEPIAEPLSSDSVQSALNRLEAFFVQTYHLKDALNGEASSTGVARATVEAAISNHPDLALLADLANLDKHGRLSHPPRSGHTPAYGGLSGDTAGCPSGAWRLCLVITHAGTSHDGLDVAARVIEAWRKTLMRWGLV